MNDTVADALAIELGRLEPVVPSPLGDPGFGRDLACILDVSDDLAEVDPFSPVAIGEATLRRLTTARGSLPDHADYGIDLRSFVNRGVPVDELRDLAGQIKNEITKDDRIESATVTVALEAGNGLRFAIRIKPALVGVETFALTFAIVNGQITVEAIR